jgi:chromosome segregation ATPase
LANVTARRLTIASEIRERVQERIDDIEAKMNSIEAEIESMAAEGTDVTAVNATFQQAKARLETAKTTLASDWDRARELLAQTETDVLVRAWRNNIRGRLLNMEERIQEEIQSIANARDRLTELEAEMRSTLTGLVGCGQPQLLRRLVDRAKDLKDTIVTEIQAGNYGQAALAVGSTQELLRMAKSFEIACQNQGSISSSLQNAVETSTALANSTLASVTAING